MASILLSCAGFIYVVDPWHMFHRSWFGPDLYLDNQRVANAGLVRTGEMTVATIGSSMMEGIREADIEEVFGGEALPLSISGATAYEQSVVAQAALRRSTLKTLVWGLDWFSFMHPAGQARQNRVLPVELYLFSPDGALKYLFGLDPLVDAVRVARVWLGAPLPEDLSADPFALHYRAYEPSESNRQLVLERAAQPGYHRDWLAIRASMKCDLATLADNIARNLRPTLDAIGPDQHVYLYFMSYSDVQMALFQRYMPECFRLIPAFRRMIAEAVAPYRATTSLHDAQGVPVDFSDTRNYTDPLHHVGAVDREILAALKAGRLRVDQDSVVHRAAALQNAWASAYAAYEHLFPAPE